MKFVFALVVSIYSNSQLFIIFNKSLKYRKFKEKWQIRLLIIKIINNIWRKENYIIGDDLQTINCCTFCVRFLNTQMMIQGCKCALDAKKCQIFISDNFLERISQKVALV